MKNIQDNTGIVKNSKIWNFEKIRWADNL